MRYCSIDAFRGFAVLSMIFFNILARFSQIPLFLKHAKPHGLTFVDLGAPFFLFIVGVCMFLSFSRRKQKIKTRIELWGHFVKRNFILIIAGLFLDMLVRFKLGMTWGVLESIGVAALITLLIIEFNAKVRALVAFVLLGSYYLLALNPLIQSATIALPHGGIPGNLSWVFILIIGTIVGEYLLKKKSDCSFIKFLLFSGLILTLLGILLNIFVPISKPVVSVSYSIIATGFSLLFFLIFYFFNEIKKIKITFLQEFGINAFIGFFLHYFIIIFAGFFSLYSYFIGLTAILVALALTLLNWGIIFTLNKRNVRFTL